MRVNNPTGEAGSFSHVQEETALAVNPNNGTLCTGYNDTYGYFFGPGMFGFSSSNDDGATFQDRGQLPPSMVGFPSFSDPTMIWRRFDSKFYAVTLQGGDTHDSVGVWRSNDDCKTFNFIGTVFSNQFDDKPMTAADNDPTSAFYGRVYVVFRDDTNWQIMFTYSDDMATWAAVKPLTTAGAVPGSGGAVVNGAWPVVAPGGKLYVAWSSATDTNFDVQYVSSVNGGGIFTAIGTIVTGAVEPYDAAASAGGELKLKGGIKYDSFVQLAAGSDGCIHAAYAVGPNTSHTGDCADVYYRRTCNGTAWTTPLKINDNTNATDQWNPAISVGPGGVVSVGYYDRRNDPTNNINYDYYDRLSLDNGTSFQPSIRVTTATSPLHVEAILGGNHGDYDMQIQRAGAVLMHWSDDRSVQDGPDTDVYFQKLCPQAGCTSVIAPPRLVAPVSASRVSSHRPVFKVTLGSGATGTRVDVCRDRACTNIVTTLRGTGGSVSPAVDLPAGMLFWRAFGTNGATDGLAPSPTWEFRVTAENALVKTASGAETDFNGDGRADVAFGASNGTGTVYVYNSDGSAFGIPPTPSKTLVPPAAADANFGSSVVSAGDLNGDGFDDLVVSTTSSPSNKIYVYYGSPGGIAARPAATIVAPGPSSTGAFGRPQAAGDVNGDGYADLLASDPSYPVASGVVGRAYVYFGGPSGVSLVPSQSFDPPGPGGTLFYASFNGSAGDANGDGYGDVVIGGLSGLSPVVLYTGSATGLVSSLRLAPTAGTLDPSTGIAFGDVNGDGYSEVVMGISVPGAPALETALFAGSATGLNPVPLVYAFPAGNLHLADMNNDAFDDLIIGQAATLVTPGVIFVYPGGIFGFGLVPASTTIGLDGNASGFASAVGFLGDVDGDGRFDVGAGAPSAALLVGRFYLYRGALSGWLSGLPARTLTGTAGVGSNFGATIAAID